MFKVLLPVLMAVGVVLSGNPNAKELQRMISGGITYPSSDKAYSFFHKPISCDKVEKWNEDYKNIEIYEPLLPKILKAYDKKDDQKDCHIFFKNLFDLDLKIYQNIPALIESFKKLMTALEEATVYGHFRLKLDSFAYEPSTRRYIFIDIDKLNLRKKDDSIKNIKKELVQIFLNLLELNNLVLTSDEVTELKIIGNYNYEYSRNFVEKSELDRLTIVQDINSYRNNNDSVALTIELKENGNFFDLKVSHEGKVTTFDKIRKEDPFAIYLCRQGKEPSSTECSIIDEKDKSNDTYNYFLKKDLRIDIEVHESYTQPNKWNTDDNKRTFYEIFIMTKSKYAPGIAQIQTYYTANSSLEIKKMI